MKTTEKLLKGNDWFIYDEGLDDIYCGKLIDDEYVRFYFKKNTSEIFCVEVSNKYLSPEFIEDLNKELKKLEIKDNENK